MGTFSSQQKKRQPASNRGQIIKLQPTEGPDSNKADQQSSSASSSLNVMNNWASQSILSLNKGGGVVSSATKSKKQIGAKNNVTNNVLANKRRVVSSLLKQHQNSRSRPATDENMEFQLRNIKATTPDGGDPELTRAASNLVMSANRTPKLKRNMPSTVGLQQSHFNTIQYNINSKIGGGGGG